MKGYYIICYAVMLLVVVSAKIKTQEEGGYKVLHPVITSPAVSGPYEMVIGETLHLFCNVNKKVDYSFSGHRAIFMWWCNSTAEPCCHSAPSLCHIFINVTKSKNEANTSSTELTIEHVTKANTSTYTCYAFTEDDDYSPSPGNISIQVIVHEKVKPKLTVQPPQSVIKTIGRFVELVCNDSVGYPTTSISWYKDSHFVHSGRLLRLDNVSHHDAGVYHCSAVNRFDRVNSSVILKVQEDISESFTKYNVIACVLSALLPIIGISVWIYIREVQEKRNCRCMSNPSQAENEELIN